MSDFIDFSVYVDAATDDIRRWYVERFLRLRETAFRDPESYFRRYAALDESEAIARAESIWAEINGPNLERNIKPTRGPRDPRAAQGPETQRHRHPAAESVTEATAGSRPWHDGRRDQR